VTWQLVYNRAPGPTPVDGGRTVAGAEFTYADDADPGVARLINRGRLVVRPIDFDPATATHVDLEARQAAAEVIARNGGSYVPPPPPPTPPSFHELQQLVMPGGRLSEQGLGVSLADEVDAAVTAKIAAAPTVTSAAASAAGTAVSTALANAGISTTGLSEITTGYSLGSAIATSANGGAALANYDVNGFEGPVARLKFDAGDTNRWYLLMRLSLGTRGSLRGKRVYWRAEQRDTSATSIANRYTPNFGFNKGGDWGPGGGYTVVGTADSRVQDHGNGIYSTKVDDWIEGHPDYTDASPVHFTCRLADLGSSSTTGTFPYSCDYRVRVSVGSETHQGFTILPASHTKDRFSGDPSRFGTRLTDSSFTGGDAGHPTTPLVKSSVGIINTWTRPQLANATSAWDYNFVSTQLGTVADLKDQSFLAYWDESETEGSASQSFGLGINAYQWPSIKWIPKPGWTRHDDFYEQAKAKGWSDSTVVHLIRGHESRSNPTPAYQWSTAVVRLDSAAPSEILVADALRGFNPDEYVTRDEVADVISGTETVTAWGDSLTAGGGWTERITALTGLPVNNAGTGGENVRTIVARSGADAMVVNNITIPAATAPVLIASRATDGGIKTAFGHTVMPLLQGGAGHVNPVRIGDVEGTLTWTGTSYSDTNGTWTFTRAVAGSAVTIDRPTAMTTKADRDWTDSIAIVFIGQNGGYTNDADLVNMHVLMKEHFRGEHMVILGLSSGSAASRANYEAAMRTRFGRYFISLREYLSAYGLADAGLTPTAADTTAMADGAVPPQLLTDSVHYTAACKTVIGNMLVKKMRELNVL
jgi:hypothetical protein